MAPVDEPEKASGALDKLGGIAAGIGGGVKTIFTVEEKLKRLDERIAELIGDIDHAYELIIKQVAEIARLQGIIEGQDRIIETLNKRIDDTNANLNARFLDLDRLIDQAVELRFLRTQISARNADR
jgi:archaellum component FlaC